MVLYYDFPDFDHGIRSWYRGRGGADIGKEINPVEGRLGKEIHASEDRILLELDRIKSQ